MDWAAADSSQATSSVQSHSIQLKVKEGIPETRDQPGEDAKGKVVPLAAI